MERRLTVRLRLSPVTCPRGREQTLPRSQFPFHTRHGPALTHVRRSSTAHTTVPVLKRTLECTAVEDGDTNRLPQERPRVTPEGVERVARYSEAPPSRVAPHSRVAPRQIDPRRSSAGASDPIPGGISAFRRRSSICGCRHRRAGRRRARRRPAWHPPPSAPGRRRTSWRGRCCACSSCSGRAPP